MKRKSNIIVQKYTHDLAEPQDDLNDLDEESEEARQTLDGDVYDNSANHIETQDDDEEEKNDSSHENEENEAGDEIYSVSTHLIFIIF
jgi:hypothetical protein